MRGAAALVLLAAASCSLSREGLAPDDAGPVVPSCDEPGGCPRRFADDSFETFSLGSTPDHGADLLIDARGAVRPYHVRDLDGDGFSDLVVTQLRDDLGPAPEARVYLGGPGGLSDDRSLKVPAVATSAAAVADLDGDGAADLVLARHWDGGSYAVDSEIHWGPPPFDDDARPPTLLPTVGAHGVAVGDLDRDGWLDLAFAQIRNADNSSYEIPSRIYLGAADGFSRDRFAEIPTVGASGVAIGDLDGDGWLDLVVGSYFDGARYVRDSHVWLGGPAGFDASRRIALTTHGTLGLGIADFDGDGALDVLFASHFDETTRRTPSLLYYGSPTGPTMTGRRADVPTSAAFGVAIARLDADGLLDVAWTGFYDDSAAWAAPSGVVFGTFAAFEGARTTPVGAIGGSVGVAIADHDSDGALDVAFGSHYDGTSFAQPVLVVPGSGAGPVPERAVRLPASGSHVGVTRDVGGVGDRRDRYEYVSRAWGSGAPSLAARITWRADVPAHGTICLQLRNAESETALARAAWRGGLDETDGCVPMGTTDLPARERGAWWQYRARFGRTSPAAGLALRSVVLEIGP